MDITKCLTVSTAHVSEQTAAKLKYEPTMNQLWISVYEKGEYGFWIYVPEYLPEMAVNIPEDLFRCLSLAQRNGCEWLCLDCDGEVLESLAVYDW